MRAGAGHSTSAAAAAAAAGAAMTSAASRGQSPSTGRAHSRLNSVRFNHHTCTAQVQVTPASGMSTAARVSVSRRPPPQQTTRRA